MNPKEVNSIFQEEAESKRYLGIFGAVEDPIVSLDIIGDSPPSFAGYFKG